jgi:hypothetical protein
MKSILRKLDVLSVFAAWALLIVFFASLAYAKFFSDAEASAIHLVYLFGAFIGAVVLHIVLSFLNRCPHCNQCLTVQCFEKPHSASSGSWDKVVWHCFSGSVVCIRCGKRVATNDL